MTANVSPDSERALEAYADATRIVASAQLVRRFQASVVEERARSAGRPWSGLVASARGIGSRWSEPFGIAFAPHVTFALRLQALVLVLLTVLVLGAVVGGAGTVLVSVLHGPDRGAHLPGLVVDPGPSSRTPVPVLPPAAVVHTSALPSMPTASPTPVVSVRVLAQHATHPSHRHRRHRASSSHPEGRLLPGTWSRGRHRAS